MQREASGGVSLSERQQRDFMSALALLAVLMQAATSLHLHAQPDQWPRALQADLGLGFALTLLVLTRVRALALGTLQKLVVGAVALWLVLNLASVIRTARPITSGVLIHMVLLALFAYTWLPARGAALLVGPAYVLLVLAATFSRAPDVPGLLLTGLVLPLTWYLTVHGRVVSGERARGVRLAALAATDPLTGCLNRRAGHSELLALAEQWAARPERLSVALCDLDHFKRINDTRGHEQGDEALAQVAQTLRAHLRAGDVVVRWGARSFCWCWPT
ncbi:diguanylate cyclase domain-containing protein [Deinococcus multiflagellatus]|uniref:Diguanylate cyclase domain-containing protein n=1 Tax=Deinococcus multiflagellatus TaxID=1656887 RepID=A0ABW1ZI14_9DEIO